MRVTLSGKRPIDFPIGFKTSLSNWDESNERVFDSNYSIDINKKIDEYRSAITDVFTRYEVLEKRVPTIYEVKELFNDIVGRKPIFKEEKITIKKAFEEYINTIGAQNNWSESSYKKNNTIKKHLIKTTNNIPLSEITVETLQSFVQALLHSGMRNTTVQKNYQFVRWFISWARRKGYYLGNADKDFKLRLKGTDGNQKEIIYLSLEELKKLENCDIPRQKKYLIQIRDVFLFCCFTSLRYSDVKVLRKADIINGNIRIVTQKTTDGLIIELNDRARTILDKYKDYQSKDGLALPVISNQKYNEYLKELGQLAGLDTQTRIVYYKGNKRYDEFYPKYQLLTSHVARRTFVVTALLLGIPVEVIIRWTGHSDYDALKPYVAIVDQLKKSEMNKFNSL
jgi:integrase